MRRFACVVAGLAFLLAQPAAAQQNLGGWQSADSGQAGKGSWTKSLSVNVGQASSSSEILAPAPGLPGPPPTLSVVTPQPGEAVSTSNRQYVISGTAGPVGSVDGVQVWLNGEANTDGATPLGDADVHADGTWSLFFDAAQFMPIDSNLYVYARSALNGKRREVVVHFSITNRR